MKRNELVFTILVFFLTSPGLSVFLLADPAARQQGAPGTGKVRAGPTQGQENFISDLVKAANESQGANFEGIKCLERVPFPGGGAYPFFTDTLLEPEKTVPFLEKILEKGIIHPWRIELSPENDGKVSCQIRGVAIFFEDSTGSMQDKGGQGIPPFLRFLETLLPYKNQKVASPTRLAGGIEIIRIREDLSSRLCMKLKAYNELLRLEKILKESGLFSEVTVLECVPRSDAEGYLPFECELKLAVKKTWPTGLDKGNLF